VLVVLFLFTLAAQTAYISDWFRDKELAFALGLNIAISRGGSVLSFIISSHIYNASESLSFSFGIGSLLLSVSLILAACTIIMDQHVEHTTGYSPQKASTRKIVLKDLMKLNSRFWIIVLSVIGYYTSFLSFMNIAPNFTRERFGFSSQMGGLVSVNGLINTSHSST
jgi:nitrate/nitrite transporter NarK